jgi:hypothetical protein
VSFEEVRSRLDALRGSSSGALLSNYFFAAATPVSGLLQVEGALAWWHDQHDFSRLLFAASDASALRLLLQILPRQRFACDFIARASASQRAAVREACSATGFRLRATFARHASAALRPPVRPGARIGTVADAEHIYQCILSDFDRYIDHVPERDAFRRYGEERRLVVVGAPGAIEAYATFSIEGSRFHFDRLCNRRGDPMALLAALAGLYENIAQRGLKAGYLWANEANRPLLELHKRCGYSADGMIDDIYVSLPA